jgi:hypothetical protein
MTAAISIYSVEGLAASSANVRLRRVIEAPAAISSGLAWMPTSTAPGPEAACRTGHGVSADRPLERLLGELFESAP